MDALDTLEFYCLHETQPRILPSIHAREFSIRSTRIEHDTYTAAIRKIAAVHRRGRLHAHGGGLLLTGHTGTGKTTVMKFYLSHFPPRNETDGTVTPVVYVATPSSPTIKNLAEAILVAIGDPAHNRGSSEEKTRRIYNFLKRCKVELLLIDEFQHFTDTGRRSATRDVTDWLKNLLSISQVPVVLAGLPRCTETIRSNQQLARRFSAHYNIRPFSFLKSDHRLEFRGVLGTIQPEIPLACPPLHEANMANRIFVASNGVIDYVAKLLDQAVYIAAHKTPAAIDLEVLAQAFRDEIWSDAPDELNPFMPAAVLRPLTRTGEPFESHDDSPSGRRHAGSRVA